MKGIEGICADCNGFTERPGWYRWNPRYQAAIRYQIQRHRRDCLKIPRVSRFGTAGWWKVEFHTGCVVVGSFERALDTALTRRIGYV